VFLNNVVIVLVSGPKKAVGTTHTCLANAKQNSRC
jgi:hypothetical protein